MRLLAHFCRWGVKKKTNNLITSQKKLVALDVSSLRGCCRAAVKTQEVNTAT